MDKTELQEILRLHKAWLNDEEGGKRADLSCADLSCADLSCADLSYAVLRCADLRDADLSGADLSGADLSGADLRSADLRCADLSGAVLRGADLSGAVLCSAVLRGADLSGAEFGFNAFFGGVAGAPFFQAVCGFGSRNAALTLLAVGEREDWRWFTGCFTGSEGELRAAVEFKHGDSKAGRCYMRAIDYLVAQAEDNAKEA